MEEKIILYSTHCPMCKQLERQLNMKEIPYEEIDDAEKMRELGFTHAPILEVDGERMDFASAIRWIKSRG